jgi:hypothetical protein
MIYFFLFIRYNIILDAAGLGADVGPKYADCLKDWNLSKFITLRSPMLRNVDEYGMVAGMMKNTVDLVVTNMKTGLTSQCSTTRWGFFLPLSDAIKEITALVEQGKVSALACLLFYKKRERERECVCVCVCVFVCVCKRERERMSELMSE